MKRKKIFLISLFALFTIIGAFNLYSYATENNQQEKSMLEFPAGSSYEKEWAKVDSLEKKGLTRSALQMVEVIYKKAKQDNNAPQFVKTVIYRMKYESYVEEDSFEKAIARLKEETLTAQFPIKPVLHSVLAEVYWRYYQNNRYKFYNRTETVNFDNKDIRTWDLKKIVAEVITHYQLSLKNPDSLKRTSLNVYDEILVREQAESRKLRPTLYDFLAHRAVDFYMNEETSLTQPAYKFELTEDHFKPFDEFVKIKITTRDSFSLKFYAITVLQDLLAFHQKDITPDALIDADLKRLKFVKNNAVSEIKDSLYLTALGQIKEQFTTSPELAEVSYEMANVFFEKGNKYDPHVSDENKWFKLEALKICEDAIRQFPNSFGAQNCKYLIARIKEKTLLFTTEKANTINKPFRALVTYKNINKVFFRVVALPLEKFSNSLERQYGEELVKNYLTLASIKQWSVELPNDNDFQQHSVEVKVSELPAGHYVILASNNNEFSYNNNGVAYGYTWVSDISYISRNMLDGTYEIYTLNRGSGEPLKGVNVQLWYEKYDYTSRKYNFEKSEKYVSDGNGHLKIPASEEYRNFHMEFTYKKDKLYSDYPTYQYRQYKNEKQTQIKTFFFTDRAIYRPGQTVYFKGIMIETGGEKNEIKPGQKTTVTFYDVNGRKVSNLDLTSNEYGTFSGTFTAPGVLNGQMYISNGSGTHYFSVEEYKRPKFEVLFEPVKGVYKLGEKVKIKGTAKAYAGSNIDDAEVNYRVVRNASFPHWWWYYRGGYPDSPEMEIANGIRKTNESGMFEIDFAAIPDLSISKSYHPTYTYTVYADVTDINGETRSSQQYITVGYTAMVINMDIPELLNKEIKEEYTINTTNLNGEFEPDTVNITVYQLKQPERIFRERQWNQPDKFVMSAEEYYSAFPQDIYNDENNKYKWEKAEKVYETTLETEKDKKLKLENLHDWKQGHYLIEANTVDQFGEEVKEVKYIVLFSEKEKEVPVNTPGWFTVLNNKGEPGEKARFLIGSKEKNVKVLYEMEHENKIIKKDWLSIKNEQKIIEIPIEEKHRGNFSVHFIFIKNNRKYQYDQVITVPYTNKELDIAFETFRDKLQPGQQEEWKIKIKGKKGEKVASEMVATLYDASLDAFRANKWHFDIYKNFSSSLTWHAEQAFGVSSSSLFAMDWNLYPTITTRTYDRLKWFGFEHSYGYHDMMSKSAARQVNAQMAESAGESGHEEPLIDADNAATGGTIAHEDATKKPIRKPEENLERQEQKSTEMAAIKTRSNFNETAFFFPHLETNENGEIIIKFTIPEALTRWKLIGFAHTKDLKYGQIQKELLTQKELMVMPNAPRFFREGDKITFTSKVSNLSEKDLNGTAQLLLFDALTMKPVDELLKNSKMVRNFEAKKGQSTLLSWNIEIAEGIQAISYKVLAKAGDFTDGEEMVLPVLTNRMLVTESLPLPVRGKQTKTYTLEKLRSSAKSTTLRNHKLTLEFTSNPAWYAIQALPYLMEYPYEFSEQVFSRFYANSIASHIANSSPKIKTVFDSWRNYDPSALLSKLEKNQELKSLLLEETPWVLDAKDENERKKRIALLFDLNRMSGELEQAQNKLLKMQTPNGGFPWFSGMRDDRYITQHIVTGFGHLDHLGIKQVREDKRVWSMMEKAIFYLDDRLREDYEDLLKYKADLSKKHLGGIQIQYFYARSYFKNIKIDSKNQKAFDFYFGQMKKYWLENNRYMQGMIALSLHRYEIKETPLDIIKSLKENSLNNEEMGMYWKENVGGYYWYEAPIETQALLIEAFDEVAKDNKSVEDMRVWLLKQKQTQDWKTTKATTEACYALLLKGTDWLATSSKVNITVGDIKIEPGSMPDLKVEAGTGYFKTSWSGSEIKPEMGKVTVTKNDEGVSWGALYWQYFEQLDKITPHETPLKLNKKLFIEKASGTGPVIIPVTEKTKLKTGDKIIVRIELRVDRTMEYVHMKDMRAAGFEPINVISKYKFQGGLGYYESTRDAATNFFLSYLPKGTYVFEYPVRVSHEGDFSNGISTIQCMYAPEFTSHSEGIRVKAGE